MSTFDFLILVVLIADYLVAVPAFLSSSEVPLILLGIAIAIAPVFIIYTRFFKESQK